MKKLFLFVMIILPAALLSQTVSGLKVMPGAAGSASTVTFDVEWTAATLPTPWLDSMWVFVDYNKNGKMERLLISGGTLTEHTATKTGTGIFIPENDMGAWVYGDARYAGSFSTKVQLFTKEIDITIAGACAYASSYPPVSNWIDDTKIGFTGTPMYEITLLNSDGSTTVTVEAGSTFLLPCSYTVSSFTDKTGAPGILGCIPSTDIYNLTVSATTYCAGGTVTFALDNTTSGRMYQLYRDNVEVDALTGTGSAETFTGTFAGEGNYAARVKDNGTYCAAQMTGTYTVSENPALGTPTMGGGGPQCNSANITATRGTNGTGIRWTDNSSTISPRTVTTPGTYRAVTTSDAGCESGTMSVSVTINPLPDAPTSPSSNSRCGSGTVTFSATVPSGQTIDWYTTSNGTILVSGGASVTSFSPSIGIGTTGYYAQARNTTTGCVSASRLRVNGVANPIPGVPTMGGAATQCNSATVTATRGTNGTGIRWTDGDGSSTVSPRTVTTPGTYYAVTTSAAGCTSGTASVSVTITTQKGAEGEPVTACGCIQENKLGDCYGTCQVSCPFTMCGFSVTAFNVIMSKWGSSWCNDLPGGGWRIPTKQELLCLCTNSSNVPAGIISYWAWSSDVAENGNHIAVELFSGNETSIGDSYNFTYLCVK